MAKFIFVTGGVVSGLGKGITAASLGRLLKCRGLKVASQKLDPYVNVDPGTMSPLQHGEVFVTDDGTETDLDLGHYERFIDENLNKYSNLTTGKVYWNVLNKERRGEYLGETKEEIERGVAAYEPAGSRMHVITFSENRRLLDDCYNAGPQSMAASLRVLGASGGKKAAVIGDMAELGELTERAHKEIGELTKELGIDTVIAIGARAKYFTEGNPSAQWFGSVDEAMGAVKAAFTAETAMLVKASHSMHFEKIVEELTKA